MRVVLDTNIILASVSPYSPYRLVFDKFEAGDYSICFTTEILLEYEEKLTEKFSKSVAELTIGSLLLKQNTIQTEVFFRMRLIYPDLDDNKFTDCAFAANAHLLVTNDRDFNTIKNVNFPKLTVIKMNEFMEILKSI